MKYYEEVAREMQEKPLSAGLWTKAYAEMEGDDAKARALYIKYRVAQLAEAKASQSPKPDKQTVSSRTRKHNLAVLAFIIIVIVCLVCIVKHYTSTTSSNPASYDADAAKDFRANGFKSLVLGMKLQDVTLDYTVTTGFVPRVVEKQLVERFITHLSSKKQVWSEKLGEPR